MASTDPKTPVAIRPLAPQDAGEVTLLIRQLGYDRLQGEVLGWIEELGPQQAAFVACIPDECGGEVVAGWIEVSIERRLQSPPHALIGGLVVKDGVRGAGIGRLLCEAAEAWSWQRVDILRVTSRSTRAAAHRFYLRDGYRQVKTSLIFEKKRP